MVTQDMLRRMANAAAARKLADAEYEKARRAVMAGFRDRVLEPGPLTLREITSVRQHFNLKDVERVLADECLQRFGRPLDGVMGLLYGPEERHRRGRGWGDGRLKDDDRYRVVNFADLSKTLSDKYDILDEKDLNPAERLWLARPSILIALSDPKFPADRREAILARGGLEVMGQFIELKDLKASDLAKSQGRPPMAERDRELWSKLQAWSGEPTDRGERARRIEQLEAILARLKR